MTSVRQTIEHSVYCKRTTVAILTASLLAFAGCSNKPPKIKPPKLNAASAAKDAMTAYDADNDGLIADSELSAAPSLKAALVTLDQNSDGKVDEAEIRARIESWQESGAGITRIQCKVFKNGQPVEGATVTFEPESFLGDEMRTALDQTDLYGMASPSIPKDQRLAPTDPRGLQLGLYKVRISLMKNGSESIPAKFNTETTLGQQVSNDDPAVLNHRMVFEL